MQALAAARTQANERWLGRSMRTLGGAIESAVGRLAREAREGRDDRRSRLQAIREALLPGGEPQERRANALEFAARYGPAWVRALVEDVEPWRLDHQLITFEI
jgi:uncharacterized protein YllA (UPF0747 family)